MTRHEKSAHFSRRNLLKAGGALVVLIGAPHAFETANAADETAAASPKSPGLPPIEYARALQMFLRDQLTPREREIVGLMFAGYPNTKIAERLRLSINTIKNHKKRLYAKLDITTERELFMNFVSFLFEGAEA